MLTPLTLDSINDAGPNTCMLLFGHRERENQPQKHRLIPLKPIVRDIGETKATALPAFHALTRYNVTYNDLQERSARVNVHVATGRHSKMQTMG